MPIKSKLFLLIFFVLFSNSYAQFYQTKNGKPFTIEGKIWVIDGDSFTLTTKNLKKIEIRLFGINAPELHTKQGKKAKWGLINYVKKDNWVKCNVVDTDKYKRKVAVCFNKKGDLAEFLLKNGHARIFKKYIKIAPKKFIENYKKLQKLKYNYDY